MTWLTPDWQGFDEALDAIAVMGPEERPTGLGESPSKYLARKFQRELTAAHPVAAAQTPAPTAPVTAAPSFTALTGATPSKRSARPTPGAA